MASAAVEKVLSAFEKEIARLRLSRSCPVGKEGGVGEDD